MAACDHMHDWWYGNQLGGYVSMGVIPDESHYGIDTNLCFSYPCEISTSGEWKIVEGLELNEFQKEKLLATEKELHGERDIALKKQ